MKILLTGASGLLGANLLKQFNSEDEVFKLGRASASFDTQHISMDLREPLPIERLPREIDLVVHFAQSPRYRDAPEGNAEVFKVNVGATQELLEYSRIAGAKQFIYASSGSVYSSNDAPHGEDECIDLTLPGNHYAATKKAAEALAMSYSNYFDVLVPRYFFPFGKGQDNRMLLPRLIEAVSNGDVIQLSGENGIRINPTPAYLAAEWTHDLIRSKSKGNYNVATTTSLSIREIVEIISKYVGKKANFAVRESSQDVLADTNKLSQRLGKSLNLSLDREIEIFVESLLL